MGKAENGNGKFKEQTPPTQWSFLEDITGFNLYGALPHEKRIKGDPYASALASLEATAREAGTREMVVDATHVIPAILKTITLKKPLGIDEVQIIIVSSSTTMGEGGEQVEREEIGVFGIVPYGPKPLMSKIFLEREGIELFKIMTNTENTTLPQAAIGYSNILKIGPEEYASALLRGGFDPKITVYTLQNPDGGEGEPIPLFPKGVTPKRRIISPAA